MDALKSGLLIIFIVIGAIIGITAMLNQAPTVASLTNTATGTTLANAGVTSSTLAGTVYSFANVFWALGALGIVAAVVYKTYKSK